MEETKSIAFFSGYAKEKYKEMLEKLKRHILVSKLKSEEIQNKIVERADQRRDLQEINMYCNDFEKRPRLTKERKMATLYSEVEKLRIVFATSTMAENMIGTVLDGTSVLIYDEATQGSWTVLTHLIASLPKLEKVFVTGDRFQLGVHLQELPPLLQKGFGLESMVDQLVISPLVLKTKLIVCYRMHPILVEMVSFASYEQNGEFLEPGRSADELSLLSSKFPLPMQNCPIVLINVVGTCRQGIQSHSLTNDLHTSVTVRIVSVLLSNLGPTSVSIVVICLYLFQKECLKREFEDLGIKILVVSVDEFQAQECDIALVVTTRSGQRVGNLSENSEFLKDEQRATVALSRARHGLFLVGDFTVLSAGQVWDRFISKSSTLTQAVGQELNTEKKTGAHSLDQRSLEEIRLVATLVVAGDTSRVTVKNQAPAQTDVKCVLI